MTAPERMTAFLLENGGPSVQLRVKREITSSITAEEENVLLSEIMTEPVYRLVSGCQKENGWLGNGFHGPNKNAEPSKAVSIVCFKKTRNGLVGIILIFLPIQSVGRHRRIVRCSRRLLKN